MDIVVTPSSELGLSRLTDRLGRSAGTIERIPPLAYAIFPQPGGALNGLGQGTVKSLDEAMSAIAIHTKGGCQLASGEQPE
jgi:hypothetical protein